MSLKFKLYQTCHSDELLHHFDIVNVNGINNSNYILVCGDLIKGAKDKQLKVKGPVRMPTKVR